MRKFALKALFSILTLHKTASRRTDRDRIVVIFSTAVTVGLAALYVWGKTTSRW